jgi:hypothetical protein
MGERRPLADAAPVALAREAETIGVTGLTFLLGLISI